MMATPQWTCITHAGQVRAGTLTTGYVMEGSSEGRLSLSQEQQEQRLEFWFGCIVLLRNFVLIGQRTL
jgi:hypothetical protein